MHFLLNFYEITKRRVFCAVSFPNSRTVTLILINSYTVITLQHSFLFLYFQLFIKIMCSKKYVNVLKFVVRPPRIVQLKNYVYIA